MCFEALNGLPGPYIKQFMENVGHDGKLVLFPPFSSLFLLPLLSLLLLPLLSLLLPPLLPLLLLPLLSFNLPLRPIVPTLAFFLPLYLSSYLQDEHCECRAKANGAGLNKMLAGFSNNRATALCTFAYSPDPQHEPILFEGRTEGRIVPARGPTNFGWDPCFEPLESEGKTFAEMAGEEKNAISHRYRALEKLRVYLSENQKA